MICSRVWHNSKFFVPFKIISCLLIISLVLSIFGCGVKEQDKLKMMQIIGSKAPNFEKTIQQNIQKDTRIKDISFGKYKWEFEKTKQTGIYLAKYGYFGQVVWWKQLIGVGIEIFTTIVTIGFLSYNPFPTGSQTGLYYSLVVDLNNGSVRNFR